MPTPSTSTVPVSDRLPDINPFDQRRISPPHRSHTGAEWIAQRRARDVAEVTRRARYRRSHAPARRSTFGVHQPTRPRRAAPSRTGRPDRHVGGAKDARTGEASGSTAATHSAPLGAGRCELA